MNVEHGQTASVLEKLQGYFQTRKEKNPLLYAKKDFKTPEKILTDVNRLFKLRYINYDGFIRETTSSFDRLKNPNDIEPNHLLATLIVLSNPISGKPSDNLIKSDIKNSIDTLLGDKLSLNTPIYLVLRAVRENDLKWLKTRNKFTVEKTQELLKKLLLSINVPETRKAVEELFHQLLDLKVEDKPSIIIEDQPVGLDVDMDRLQEEIRIRKRYAKERLFSDENLGQNTDDPKASDRLSFFEMFLKYTDTTIDKNGNINVIPGKKDPFSHPDDYFFQETNFIAVFGPKDYQNTLTSAVLVLMSKDQTTDLSWLFDCKKPGEFKHARKMIETFSQVLKKIINNPEAQNSLIQSLNQPTDSGKLNLSLLNKELAGIIFQQFYPQEKSFDDNQLVKFLNLPGAANAIFALRKIFFINLIKKEVKQNKNLLTAEHEYLQPNSEKYTRDQGALKGLLKDDVQIARFVEIPEKDLINHLAYLTVEQYLRLPGNRRYFHNRHLTFQKDKEGYDILPMPEKIIVGKSGIRIHIISVFNQGKDNSYVDVYYSEDMIGQIPVE